MITDKYRVREYVSSVVGEKYLSTLYGVYDTTDALQSARPSLPDRFVLKTNHWSGEIFFVSDKMRCEWDQIIRELDTLMRRNYYYQKKSGVIRPAGEWVYKDIVPKILCEEYVTESGSESGVPKDYKLFCFNGVVQYIQVHIGRFSDQHERCFYNTKWEKQLGMVDGFFYTEEVPRPVQLGEMIEVAQALSAGLPHLRVDLYCPDNERIIFSELTLYHGSGFESFYHGAVPKVSYPDDWDVRLGELITLPQKQK